MIEAFGGSVARNQHFQTTIQNYPQLFNEKGPIEPAKKPPRYYWEKALRKLTSKPALVESSDGVLKLTPIGRSKLAGLQRAGSELIDDLMEIENRDLSATMKSRLVDARIGQGAFRKQVLQDWGNRCAVTGSITLEAIRASHIKPWKNSNDRERLDPNNGIPLIANLDALFDVGLISFEPTGEMIAAAEMSNSERKIFGVASARLTRKPKAKMARYLAHHRTIHNFRNSTDRK